MMLQPYLKNKRIKRECACGHVYEYYDRLYSSKIKSHESSDRHCINLAKKAPPPSVEEKTAAAEAVAPANTDRGSRSKTQAMKKEALKKPGSVIFSFKNRGFLYVVVNSHKKSWDDVQEWLLSGTRSYQECLCGRGIRNNDCTCLRLELLMFPSYSMLFLHPRTAHCGVRFYEKTQAEESNCWKLKNDITVQYVRAHAYLLHDHVSLLSDAVKFNTKKHEWNQAAVANVHLRDLSLPGEPNDSGKFQKYGFACAKGVLLSEGSTYARYITEDELRREVTELPGDSWGCISLNNAGRKSHKATIMAPAVLGGGDHIVWLDEILKPAVHDGMERVFGDASKSWSPTIWCALLASNVAAMAPLPAPRSTPGPVPWNTRVAGPAQQLHRDTNVD